MKLRKDTEALGDLKNAVFTLGGLLVMSVGLVFILIISYISTLRKKYR
jgi:hypothetical protein|tara:strand:+ start:503 stop:646 length:144 start_codon:yes stop_codon:yes gene_type:complete